LLTLWAQIDFGKIQGRLSGRLSSLDYTRGIIAFRRTLLICVTISDTAKGALLGRRYTRRNRLKIPGERRSGRHLSETPVGKQVIAEFVKPMVERLKGGIDPPGRLADRTRSGCDTQGPPDGN
jgi:hypothetical protein